MADTTNVITNVGFGAEGLYTGDMEYYLNTKISPVFEQNADVLAPTKIPNVETAPSSTESSGPYIWKYQ